MDTQCAVGGCSLHCNNLLFKQKYTSCMQITIKEQQKIDTNANSKGVTATSAPHTN